MKKKILLLAASGVLGLALAGCGGPHYGYGYYGAPPPPPPPRAYGVMGYAPGPGYVWVDGYWDWRGRNYNWVGGHWMRPPHRRATWVPGHWDRRGRNYAWRPGHWRR